MKKALLALMLVLAGSCVYAEPLYEPFSMQKEAGRIRFGYSELYFERAYKYPEPGGWFEILLAGYNAGLLKAMRQEVSANWLFDMGLTLDLSAVYVSQKLKDPAISDKGEIDMNEFHGCELTASYRSFGFLISAGAGMPLYSRDYSDPRLVNFQQGYSLIGGVAYSAELWLFELAAYSKAEMFLTYLKRDNISEILAEYSAGAYGGIRCYEDEFQTVTAGASMDISAADSYDFLAYTIIAVPQIQIKFRSGLSIMAGAEILQATGDTFERGADSIFYTAKIYYTPSNAAAGAAMDLSPTADAYGNTLQGSK